MSEQMLAPVPRARIAVPAQARWARRVSLGTRIQNARLAARMSDAQLVEGLTSIAYLSRIEASERRPSQGLLRELAHRLHLDVDELTHSESPIAEGLRFELAHADHLLASEQLTEAIRVSADLAAVARAIGSVEMADAALLVQALAMSAQGDHAGALSMVLPLTTGPVGLPAMVAVVRFQVALGDFEEAIRFGGRTADVAAAHDHLSFPETADLAISLCQAYLAIGRDRAAGRAARAALKYLPKNSTGPTSEHPRHLAGPISYQSFAQAVRHAEEAVAELQDIKLHQDITLLRAYSAPATRRAIN